MSLYVPTGTPPLISTAVARIERRLPSAGEVRVRQGQRVEPEEVVASAYLSGTPVIVNLARALSIAPALVERAMVREVGNKVSRGEMLARSSRIGGRTCLSPITGKIEAVDAETGYVTISPDPVQFNLAASVRGLVMEIIPSLGVVIETPAAQVYGAFGMGRERAGVLRLLVTDPAEPIRPEMIDARSAYAIIIGGSGISAAALRRAAQEQVRGVIVGSIDEAELRAFLGWASPASWRSGLGDWAFPNADLPLDLTLVVTEGFGSRPMALPLFELLANHDRQETLIEGSTRLRAPLQRPRVVVPLSSRTAGVQIEPPRPALRSGASVRLLDSAHLGQVGQVRSVSASPRRLTTRVRARAVEVALDDGTTVLLPQADVEVLA
ncbi:MAG TPA: hypothetical protein PKK15_03105 [Kouleothrix sp.]|uniref:hypothetical protein n=1 Tax=Kouleothrix sp. TaxID=2779161 RepID=UPI002B88DF4B|nr:hypothetical protein [Kouleothrix sp.]